MSIRGSITVMIESFIFTSSNLTALTKFVSLKPHVLLESNFIGNVPLGHSGVLPGCPMGNWETISLLTFLLVKRLNWLNIRWLHPSFPFLRWNPDNFGGSMWFPMEPTISEKSRHNFPSSLWSSRRGINLFPGFNGFLNGSIYSWNWA